MSSKTNESTAYGTNIVLMALIECLISSKVVDASDLKARVEQWKSLMLKESDDVAAAALVESTTAYLGKMAEIYSAKKGGRDA